MYAPTVIEKKEHSERVYDIFSRLLEDRIIMLSGVITDEASSLVVASLLYLAASDANADIYLYINSPGGSITAGMAIYDTMCYIKPDVSTICIGQAASMGAFLLSSGAKGKRVSLPNSEIMIHQPLGGVQGQATEILIAAKHICKVKDRINAILAKNTNKTVEQIIIDTERDNFMYPEDALEYGIIDSISEI